MMGIFAAVALVSYWPTPSVGVLRQYGSYRSKCGTGRRALKPALLTHPGSGPAYFCCPAQCSSRVTIC